jgi:hypothetical protein
MYLENLEKEKLNKEINSNNDSKDNLNLNIDNINDITSSIKGLSNDITNNDSIINTNFQLNKNKYTHQKNESSESNIFKTVNYLAIEQLKDNMRNKKKNTNIISKVNTLSIIQDNKNNDYNKLYQNQMTNNENKKKYFKKIIPIKNNKLEARLFFNFNRSQSVLHSIYMMLLFLSFSNSFTNSFTIVVFPDCLIPLINLILSLSLYLSKSFK